MNVEEEQDSNISSNWQSIDIFLFSNGQQSSPPRKYHLRSDELNWWEATLNNLARSHYGLQHPLIYLYTTDGRRVDSPLELRDGKAYVAVEPPESFIDTGYEKYLIKASRSWEKRQAKIAGPVDIKEAETPGTLIVESEQSVLVNLDLPGLEAPNENSVLKSSKDVEGGPWVGESRSGESGAKLDDGGIQSGEYGAKLNDFIGKPVDHGGGQLDDGNRPSEHSGSPIEHEGAKADREDRSDKNIDRGGEYEGKESKDEGRGAGVQPLYSHVDRTGVDHGGSPALGGQQWSSSLKEHSSRGGEHEIRAGEHGSRTGEYGARMGERDGRGVDHEGRRGENGNKRVCQGGRSGEYNGKLGEHRGRGGLHAGKRGEYRSRGGVQGGSNVCRVSEHLLKVDGGGASGTAGLSKTSEAQQSVQRSSIPTTKPLKQNKRRAPGELHSARKPISTTTTLPVPQRRYDDKKPTKNSRESPSNKIVGKSAKLPNGSMTSHAVGKVVPKYPFKRVAAPAVLPPSTNFDQTIIAKKSVSLTKITSTNKGLTTDSALVENIIDDTVVISTNLSGNLENGNEIASMRYDLGNKPILEGIHHYSDETYTELNSIRPNTSSITVNKDVRINKEQLTETAKKCGHNISNSKHLLESNSKLGIPRIRSGQRNNIIATDDRSDDNYIAFINKGDVVNLKLNIKVRNGERTFKTSHKLDRTSRSLTKITKSEKGSQISCDNEIFVHSKLLQALLNKECIQGSGFESSPKVVVVQCACCGQKIDNPLPCDPTLCNDSKKYFVLLGDLEYEKGEGCKCIPGTQNPNNTIHSTCLAMRSHSNAALESKMMQDTKCCPSPNEAKSPATTCLAETHRSEHIAPEHSENITNNQNMECCSFPPHESSEKSVTQNRTWKSRVEAKAGYPRLFTQFADKHTQTAWCSVLLEARRHDDCRYSFHLPPLQVLQYYSCCE